MANAADPCPSCGHVRVYHPGGQGCRLSGCTCGRFADNEDEQPAGQRVCVDVPPGYAVTFQLVPTEASDAAA